MTGMALVNLLLLLAGFVCFAIATLSAPARFNLVALGLLFWIAEPLLHSIRVCC